MHELSIAMSIMEGVSEVMRERKGQRLKTVFLKIGPLSGVDKDALTFAWDSATQETPLAGAELRYQDTAPVGGCPNCGADQPAVSIHRLFCQVCDTPLPYLISGDELEIDTLEIEDEPAQVS